MKHIQIWSPGRVNLIGEHTDYNDGWVLPLAIEHGTTLTIEERSDDLLYTIAQRISGQTDSIALADLDHKRGNSWIAYTRGSAWALQQYGLQFPGATISIDSNLPLGGGLSSSASLEVGIIVGLAALTEQPLEAKTAALLAQKAEREYVGVQCGIMDQLAVAAGQAHHALLIDCRTLEIFPVPIPQSVSILIVDSGVARTLAGSAYNQRRAECEHAVQVFKGYDRSVKALRDVSPQLLQHAINDGKISGSIQQRARHVITENQRTQAAAEALNQGNIAEVGRLMNESHLSLRDDYEVSSQPLDTLSQLLRQQPGVWGARLTGAGFGGCCVALVESSVLDEVADWIGPAYQQATGEHPTVIKTRAAAGTHVLSEDNI